MDNSNLIILLNGFAISVGLLVAIGPQNAYLLRKGLKRRHVFVVATTCFLGDVLLIVLAGAGVGHLAQHNQLAGSLLSWGGAAFLLWYGWRNFRSASQGSAFSDQDIDEAGKEARGKGALGAIFMALFLTLLNPHVYVDTFVILGGLAAQYGESERNIFVLGAVMGSGAWFYGIGYGATFLTPFFQNPKSWRMLDMGVGVIMWTMAIFLIWGQLA